jgi:thymidylate kinase
MYILEGPDCAGKTTLAKQICEHESMDYTHYSAHAPTQFILDMMRMPADQWAVFDRMHLSHIPYDQVYRGGIPSAESVRIVDDVAYGLKAKLILCLPPWTYVEDVFRFQKEERGELLRDVHELRAIYDWYAKFACKYTRLPIFIYDYTQHTYKDVLEWKPLQYQTTS